METKDKITASRTFSITLDTLLEYIHQQYPKNTLVVYGLDITKSEEGDACFAAVGDTDKLFTLAGRMADKDRDARRFLVESFCRWILAQNQTQISAPELAIQNACFEWLNSSTSSIRKQQLHSYRLGQEVTWEELEMRITDVQKELQRLQSMRKGSSIISMLTAEIKRLKKAGDLKAAADKQCELNRILDQITKAEKRKKQLIELAANARRAKAEKKLQRQKAEQDRNRYQFQPGKAAKAKMQKMRQEKAERAARKKKAQEGRDYSTAKSCSQIYTRE